MLLGGLVLVSPAGASTESLTAWWPSLGILLAVWFVVAASYTVFPKKAPTGRR